MICIVNIFSVSIQHNLMVFHVRSCGICDKYNQNTLVSLQIEMYQSFVVMLLSLLHWYNEDKIEGSEGKVVDLQEWMMSMDVT